jgi:hypothetical protein
MKKNITFMMLLLFAMACKEDQKVTKTEQLAMAVAHMPQDKIPSKYTFDWRITYEMEANGKKWIVIIW